MKATESKRPKYLTFIAALLTILSLLATVPSCSLTPKRTLTVLAGSELKDMEPIFAQMAQDTGIQLEMTYIGTLAGAEAISAGTDYDLAWFSHSRYLTLLTQDRQLIKAQEPIMYSPVVLGVKSRHAKKLGWVDNANLTWRDIADTAEAGNLDFAMTNPASSNSGFTGLIGVTAAFAQTSDAFSEDDVDAAGLTKFFKGQKMTSGSSGWLSEAYVERQNTLDGLINYESVLLSMNEAGTLEDPLELVYPKEGIVSADYPLLLLNSEMRETYDEIVNYLLSAQTQGRLMSETLRRPAITGVTLDKRIPDTQLIELPFPRSLSVINAVLFAYLNEFSPPSTTVYILDVSASMNGEPLSELKEAMALLTGSDDSVTGQFARFRARERIILMPFSDDVLYTEVIQLPEGSAQNSSELDHLRSKIEALSVQRGTAIYTALIEAYQLLELERSEQPDRLYSVVLLTDGAATRGVRESVLKDLIADEKIVTVPTFAVLFGDSDEEAMERIADWTGGRVFDSQKGLAQAFKTIRGYQ